MMTWKPSNEPARYDRARVARLDPVEAELVKLGLPLIRFRKLTGILNAIAMQIEDGGDSPEVNRLLLDALRAGVLHQVEERQAQAALRAIDIFEQAEAERWEQAKAGTLPPVGLAPEEQLDDLIQEGYSLLRSRQSTAECDACDQWLAAWEIVKEVATPQMRTASAFDDAYPGLLSSVSCWCADLEIELRNASLSDPVYHEHRLRYVREFLTRFPDERKAPDSYINYMRAQGEALWDLGQRAEAEALYEELIEYLPDEGWGYIGWSDQYWLFKREATNEYDKAEAILKRALARPNLKDRDDVLARLERLYDKWGKPEKQVNTSARHIPSTAREIGRNDPCWCGSGKKYKYCHLKSDQKE